LLIDCQQQQQPKRRRGPTQRRGGAGAQLEDETRRQTLRISLVSEKNRRSQVDIRLGIKSTTWLNRAVSMRPY